MNNKTINELFDETKQKMNGHTMLYYFHLSNLCITADPMALLSATIKIEDKEIEVFLDNCGYSEVEEKEFSFSFIISQLEFKFLLEIGKHRL